jgi:amidohydrolase
VVKDLRAAWVEAQALLPETVALRRQIHRHPELGNHTPVTRAAVLAALEGLDLDIHLSEQTSGLVACLKGTRPGRTLILRGDMDALPMPEDTGLDFASEIPGRMHACGHDAHTAMLASVARLLHARRADLAGEVRFMFQPGEEGCGGARFMLDEGLLERGGAPDAAFALHIWPTVEAGVICCRPGPMLASADALRVVLHGTGGHGSMPHDANDPIPVLCQMVQAFQTLVTRKFDVFDPVVLTVGRIEAGTANNVIPETGELIGTLRSLSPAARARLHAGVRQVAEGVAAAHGMRAEVTVTSGYPPTVNDEDFARFVGETARALRGPDGFRELANPIMGAEDFSYVLQRYPGAMAMVGVAPPGTDAASAPPCHSNHMCLHEDSMAVGVAMHAAVALRFLGTDRSA